MKYSDLILNHFHQPRNIGEMPDANCFAEAQNQACLDRICLYLKIGDRHIIAASYKVEGCVPCIAAGSWLTEYVAGKSIPELEKLTPEEVEIQLGGLPATKKHAAYLVVEVLQAALENYCR